MSGDPDTAFQYRSDGRLLHLLTLRDMPAAMITGILDRAQALAEGGRPHAGRGILGNLFFEPSTRTRCSFEIAAAHLGWHVVTVAAGTSSQVKGETLADTVQTLATMGVTAFAVRHEESGAALEAARAAPEGVAVINAGGGSADHPSQGLLDALTVRREKPDIASLSVAICGDVRHSRVARSDVQVFSALGVTDIRLVGPSELLPEEAPAGCTPVGDMNAGIRDADVIVMLRIQTERMQKASIPEPSEYHRHWGLTRERLALARPDCLVLHPGPMNRGVEIADEVADGPRSRVLQQVRNGILTRMALLEALAGA